MDYTDVICTVLDIFAKDQDAPTIVNCSAINAHWNNVVNYYPSKYLNNQWMWAYQLTRNRDSLKNFQTSILDLLLKDTQISPMIEDTWALIRFLQKTGEPVTMGLCLDRSIPNNSKTGNGLIYETDDPRIMEHVKHAILQWLWHWGYAKDLREESFDWELVEDETDKLYMYLNRHVEHDIDYHNFDLFSDENFANESKITLYLNKLKILYQISECI